MGCNLGIFRTLHRSFLILFAVVVVSIVALVHFSISKMVAEQSLAQQKSLSPALALVVEQLMQPLHVSQTLGQAKELQDVMSAAEIDEAEVFAMLTRLESEFGLSFFIASERTRTQYNSDGSKLELIEGEVSWYFKYKDDPEKAIADIGKWEDAHFYIDIKIFDESQQFLGFFGIGKSLTSFINIFEQYRQEFGYDFIFVDQNKDITLSSDPELLARNSTFQNLADLDWVKKVAPDGLDKTSLNNTLISIAEQDFLVAEIGIQPFDWTMYILTPLSDRQAELSRTFIISVVSLLVVVFALFILIYNLLYYFKREMQKNVQTDPLTQLPNRNKVELRYAEMLDRNQSVSLLLIDIDHFKAVNDTHGHNAGDNVLRQVANMLQSELREDDIIGRWGGEEFVILLADTSPEQAFEVAQKLRERLANMTASTGSLSLKVTASFGVSHTEISRPLVDILARADDALYQAKREGRNLVKMQLIDAA